MKANTSGPRHLGHERHFADPRTDPYQARVKLKGPTVCPQCTAVYAAGRWQWDGAPAETASHICPACLRIKEKAPAGTLILRGSYVAKHGAEMVQLARNQEAQEKAEHPLNRIMDVVNGGSEIEITTTDLHLPHRIANALAHAHKGHAETRYDESSYSVRIVWTRDD